MPQNVTTIFTPSPNCIALTKEFEGYSLHAYHGIEDRPDVITIGYGSIMYKDGSKPKIGDTITKQECDDLLEWELNLKANVVNAQMRGIRINQAMFDAQVDFAYNKGIGLYESCDLLKTIKANPNDPRIYDFQLDPKTGYGVPLSCKFLGYTISNGKRQPGLVRRGTAQAWLYRTGELKFFK